MHTPPVPDAELAVIRIVRDGRFASGFVCPRCGCGRVVRWGGFSGRQRYRCRGCRRTFSDLTSTVFAYSKRLSRWPQYMAEFRQSATLRGSAAETRLHLSTAFRWRHALLGAMGVREHISLAGTIEYTQMGFSYSEKGARDVDNPRRRGMRGRGWEWYQTERADAALLYGRAGTAFGCTLLPSWRASIDTLVLPKLAERCTIMSSDLPLGRMSMAARRGGHQHVTVSGRGRYAPDGVRHLENVSAYAGRLRQWIMRFRGVATRYLDNYLLWHRAVDPELGMTWVMALVRGVSRAPP